MNWEIDFLHNRVSFYPLELRLKWLHPNPRTGPIQFSFPEDDIVLRSNVCWYGRWFVPETEGCYYPMLKMDDTVLLHLPPSRTEGNIAKRDDIKRWHLFLDHCESIVCSLYGFYAVYKVPSDCKQNCYEISFINSNGVTEKFLTVYGDYLDCIRYEHQKQIINDFGNMLERNDYVEKWEMMTP